MATSDDPVERIDVPEPTLEDLGPDSIFQTRADCTECDEEQRHQVSIEMVSESGKEDSPGYDRDPYRTMTCETCGNERRERLNNARTDGGQETDQ